MLTLTAISLAIILNEQKKWGFNQSTLVNALKNLLPDHIIYPKALYLPFIAESVLFSVAVWGLVKAFRKLKLSDWTIKGGRLEIARCDSVLNKHLDEIIYFFECTNKNVVIIEDLDRFNQLQIFEALREINVHINGSEQVKQPVYFVYAIKDDMFTANDRTKFFDLIIPIVPVINTANAGPKLYEQLESCQVAGQKITDFLDKDLIYKVADYIDDMRLIINIVNEFDVYLNKMASNIDELNKNKLFAMIVIKNLYPREHAQLVRHQGVLWNVFDDFRCAKADAAIEYDNQLKPLLEELENCQSAFAKTIEEIRAIYWFKSIYGRSEDYFKIHSPRLHITTTLDQFVKDETWEQFYDEGGQLTLMGHHTYNKAPVHKSLYDIANESVPTYKDRVALVHKDIDLINSKIQHLKNQHNKLLRSTISEALIEDTIGEKFTEKLTSNQLGPVLYMLRNGYFTEDYKDYLSYFYPGSISEDDKRLSLRLGEGQSFEFSQKVDSPKALLDHLKPSDLAGGRGLINTVVNQLLANPALNHKDHSAHSFTSELANIPEEKFERFRDFVWQYMHSEYEDHQKLLATIFSINGNLIIHCITDDSPGALPKPELLYEVLSALSPKDYSALSPTIIPLLCSLEDIRLISRLADEKPEAWEWLQRNEVKFDRLSIEHCTQEISLRVIDDSLYQVNLHMLGLLIAFVTNENPAAAADTSYSAVRASGNESLISHIHDQIEMFVKKALLVQPSLKEEEHYFIELLNNSELEDDLKPQLIELTHLKVNRIKEVTQGGVREKLFETNQVTAFWTNILDAFEIDDALNPSLVEFISEPANVESLSKQDLPDGYELDNLIVALISNREISEVNASKLLSAFPGILVEHLDSARISPARMEIIRKLPNFPFSLEILKWFTRFDDTFKDDYYLYLLRYWDEYKHEAEDTECLTYEIIVKLLTGSDIDLNDQLWLCGLLNDENAEDDSILSAIISLLTSQPYEGLALNISFKRLEILINVASEKHQKTWLLAQQVKHLSWPETAEFLSKLGIDGFSQLANRSRQFKVDKSAANSALINALRQKGFLGEVREVKTTIHAYAKTSSMQLG